MKPDESVFHERKPIKKLPNRRVTKWGIQEIVYSNDELAGALNAAIDRINELEAKLEHVHEVDSGDPLTGTPLVSGVNDEGQEVWKP